jgi:uncharacterized protein involved in tolerance to divalent cations
MPSDTPTAIVYVGAFVGLIGGGVALFNSWKAVRWKRAELANSYLKNLEDDPELVFAALCLGWGKGKLAVPDTLRPYMPENVQVIEHDLKVFRKAMKRNLDRSEMNEDPRLQIYRIATDSFLSWLALVSSAIERGLFVAADVKSLGYWIGQIESERAVLNFIKTFGYQEDFDKLKHSFKKKTVYETCILPKISRLRSVLYMLTGISAADCTK